MEITMVHCARRALRAILPAGIGFALAWAAALPAAAQAGRGEPTTQEPVCTDCHDVDPAAFEKTVHGGLACIDCHEAAAKPHEETGVPPVDCATCHQDVVDALATSAHSKPVFTGISGKPACQTCHGPVHMLVSRDNPASSIHPVRIADTCAQCHASTEIAKRTGLNLIQPIEAYKASVHARAVREGKPAATCADCHGGHGILPPSNPNSTVAHQKVPETCGQCHADITRAFQASVHGEAVARGVREAPVCTDCHGEHRILGHNDPDSPVFATNLPKMTCERCHGDVRISDKFGLPKDVVVSFEDSFHGLAGRSGNQTAANCASCHGVHNILPSSSPRSTVNKANLAKTCGSCHPGAGARFAVGPVHVLATDRQHAATYWIRTIYLWIIWLTIGGMLLHNALDLRRKVLSAMHRPAVPREQRRVRMTPGFRIAHAVTMLTFIVLAYTGFALKYPETWWSAPLLRWEESFGLRGSIHRIAAVLMLAAFAFHFVHLAVSRRARACMRGMIPSLEDVHELRERLRWYVGRRPDMPRSGALSYVEKAEYLALMWGTMVMALTGFLLWFENFTLGHFPKWVADVSTVIHFYEAVLATLAILVWHFYSVMFDPLVYPMDTAWLTGRESPGRALERTQAFVETPVEPEPEGEEAAKD